jgi:hypothetical protein
LGFYERGLLLLAAARRSAERSPFRGVGGTGSSRPFAPAAFHVLSNAVQKGNLRQAEIAAREMGGLSLYDALALRELLAGPDPARFERAAVRWLQRFIDGRLPPLAEVALAATALAEVRYGDRPVGLRRQAPSARG